jgi:hypothetical protein
MKTIKQFANPIRHHFSLEVRYDSAKRVLIILAGSFRIKGVDYVLDSNEEVIFPNITRPTDFIIYLVEYEGVVRVLSDAVNDIDPPLDFLAENVSELARIALIKFVDNVSEPDVTAFSIVAIPPREEKLPAREQEPA